MGALSKIFGGKSSAEKALQRLSNADFTDQTLQKFLPPSLRFDQTGGFLESGIQGIGTTEYVECMDRLC